MWLLSNTFDGTQKIGKVALHSTIELYPMLSRVTEGHPTEWNGMMILTASEHSERWNAAIRTFGKFSEA
jgi:hypothetical protein